jgi:hypothetical protein
MAKGACNIGATERGTHASAITATPKPRSITLQAAWSGIPKQVPRALSNEANQPLWWHSRPRAAAPSLALTALSSLPSRRRRTAVEDRQDPPATARLHPGGRQRHGRCVPCPCPSHLPDSAPGDSVLETRLATRRPPCPQLCPGPLNVNLPDLCFTVRFSPCRAHVLLANLAATALTVATMAASSSSINDGASVLLLMSAEVSPARDARVAATASPSHCPPTSPRVLSLRGKRIAPCRGRSLSPLAHLTMASSPEQTHPVPESPCAASGHSESA